MDMHPTDVTAVVLIAVAALDVVALWLRLRWRIRELNVEGQFVRGVAAELPEGSTLQQHRADGAGLRLTMGPRPAEDAADD